MLEIVGSPSDYGKINDGLLQIKMISAVCETIGLRAEKYHSMECKEIDYDKITILNPNYVKISDLVKGVVSSKSYQDIVTSAETLICGINEYLTLIGRQEISKTVVLNCLRLETIDNIADVIGCIINICMYRMIK